MAIMVTVRFDSFCVAGLCAVFGLSAVGHDEPHGLEADYALPSEPVEIGEGELRYRYAPEWARNAAASGIEVGHCHSLVEDRSGRILLANTSDVHCILIFDGDGNLLSRWGNFAPSAHGLEIVVEGDREALFITTNNPGGKVFKTTLDGTILMTIECPMESGLYESADEFRPSKTMVLPNGDLIVLDGYGKDYALRFDSKGRYLSAFGGDIGSGEAQLAHWGPHGGGVDLSDPAAPVLVLALSDQQRLKRFTIDGQFLETIPIPGGNPRDVVFHRGHIVIPHLGDDWPSDRNAAGYISILDRDFKVVANLGGETARYLEDQLEPMEHDTHLFHHPHGILFDRAGNLYVAQFASNGTLPMKFERIIE